jgi:alpha-tubulin suppressor-like RCC1 family protein
VILGDGSLRCWGHGDYGALGYNNKQSLGDMPGELPLQPVPVGGKVVGLGLGSDHSCAVLVGGKIRCWGYGQYGTLGQGNQFYLGDDAGEMPVPDIVIDKPVLQIAAGGRHTCALVEGGTVRCWGLGSTGALGYNNAVTQLVPPALDVPGIAMVQQIATGTDFTCALATGGAVRCWGAGIYGSLGNGSNATLGTMANDVPPATTKIGSLQEPVQAIACGHQHGCALLTSGKVRCWGANFDRQVREVAENAIGDQAGEMPPPSLNLGAGKAIQVVAGQRHSCALMENKKVKCWGASPEEGYPGGSVVFPPPDVAVGGDVVMLASHLGRFTCALLTDDSVRCWGHGNYGQLGHGSTASIGDDETPASAGPVPY